MEDWEEDDDLGRSIQVEEIVPFMEAFPFNEYDIIVQKKIEKTRRAEVSKILLDNIEHFTENKTPIDFLFLEGDNQLMITFQSKDLEEIAQESKTITKFDALRKHLDTVLISDDIEAKLKIIKISRKFIGSGLPSLLLNESVITVLSELLELNEIRLSQNQIIALSKYSYTKFCKESATPNQLEIVRTYLNFHLHYAKIILGIIISSKIF
jgi:lipopolysaccharide biosynthesis glycosyltransferase